MIRVFAFVRNTAAETHERLVLIWCVLNLSPEEHRVLQTVYAVVSRYGLYTDLDQLLKQQMLLL